MVHELLDCLKMNKKEDEVVKKFKAEFDRLFDEEKEAIGDVVGDSIKIIEKYKKVWSKDNFNYELVEEKIEGIDFIGDIKLTIKPDGIIKHDKVNGYLLLEHKTAKKFSGGQISFFNPQSILYIWALRKLGWDVKGVLWDYLRTKPPTVPPLLKNGTLSKRKDIDTDYSTYYNAIIKNNLNVEDYKDILKIIKKKGNTFFKRKILIIPENVMELIIKDLQQTALEAEYLQYYPTRNMNLLNCRMCQYKRLCEAELNNLDMEFIKKKEYKIEEREEDNDSDEIEEEKE